MAYAKAMPEGPCQYSSVRSVCHCLCASYSGHTREPTATLTSSNNIKTEGHNTTPTALNPNHTAASSEANEAITLRSRNSSSPHSFSSTTNDGGKSLPGQESARTMPATTSPRAAQRSAATTANSTADSSTNAAANSTASGITTAADTTSAPMNATTVSTATSNASLIVFGASTVTPAYISAFRELFAMTGTAALVVDAFCTPVASPPPPPQAATTAAKASISGWGAVVCTAVTASPEASDVLLRRVQGPLPFFLTSASVPCGSTVVLQSATRRDEYACAPSSKRSGSTPYPLLCCTTPPRSLTKDTPQLPNRRRESQEVESLRRRASKKGESLGELRGMPYPKPRSAFKASKLKVEL